MSIKYKQTAYLPFVCVAAVSQPGEKLLAAAERYILQSKGKMTCICI